MKIMPPLKNAITNNFPDILNFVMYKLCDINRCVFVCTIYAYTHLCIVNRYICMPDLSLDKCRL